MGAAAPHQKYINARADTGAWLHTVLNGRPFPPLLIAIGLGDGTALDLIEQEAPTTRVLVLEPDAATARMFLANDRCKRWRASGRLVYLAAPDYAGADEAWRIFRSADEPVVIVHPTAARAKETARARDLLKKILFGVKANADARRRFAPRYLTNCIRNLPAMLHGHDVGVLKDAYSHVPAVIAAAGPSLDHSMAELRGVSDRALVIACDTALRPLLFNGLTPQLVIGADPGLANARHFQALSDCPDTWLVAESALDPSAVTPFSDRTLWFRLANHHPWPWFQELGLDVEQMDMWGSVLTAAFQVACLAGCDPIVIVGADLCFTDGRPYARGTTYEFDWATNVAAGEALADVWRRQTTRKEMRELPDLRGVTTSTTPAMLSFRDWLLARAVRSGRRVINATGAGMLFGDGIEQGTLTSALPHLHDVAPVRSIAGEPRQLDGMRIAAAARQVRATVETDAPSKPVLDWTAFTEGGLDAATLSAALDEATVALETTDSPAPVASTIPFARYIATSEMPVFNQMPELLARLRVGLESGEPAPLEVADRGGVLVHALKLLGEICRQVAAQEDLAFGADPILAGRRPATTLYPWPEATRFAVASFEALLGRAWQGHILVGDENFFARPVRPRQESEESHEGSYQSMARPPGAGACVGLLVEWLRCALTLEDATSPDLHDALARMVGLFSVLRNSHDGVSSGASTLVVRGSTHDQSHCVEVPIPIAAGPLARILTGMEVDGINDEAFEMTNTHSALSVSIRLESPTGRSAPGDTRFSSPTFRPRILTHEGVPRLAIAYPTVRGVVCGAIHGRSSFLLDERLVVTPHHRWPLPVISELPFGDDGAVAWGHGFSCDPVREGYAMYRRCAGDEATIVSLPFRPSIGTWWRERIYWSCLPGAPGEWMGIGSWAPGQMARLELSDLSVFGMHGEGDGLVLAPRATLRDGTGLPERKLIVDGFKWDGTEIHSVPFGSYGAPAFRAVSGQWTARTYPEADIVHVASLHGHDVAIRCYYPVRLAWIGPSLLVNTIDHDLLLFEDLITTLQDLR